MKISNIQNGVTSFRVPGGDYILVDPCYIFRAPKFDWDDLCSDIFVKAMDTDGIADAGVFEVDGQKVIWTGTAHGDGGYSMKMGSGSVSVDAGLICMVSKDLFDRLGEKGLKNAIGKTSFTKAVQMSVRLISQPRWA